MGVNVRIDKVILHMLSLHTTSSQGKHKAIVFIKLLRESPLQGQPQPLGRLRVREAVTFSSFWVLAIWQSCMSPLSLAE